MDSRRQIGGLWPIYPLKLRTFGFQQVCLFAALAAIHSGEPAARDSHFHEYFEAVRGIQFGGASRVQMCKRLRHACLRIDFFIASVKARKVAQVFRDIDIRLAVDRVPPSSACHKDFLLCEQMGWSPYCPNCDRLRFRDYCCRHCELSGGARHSAVCNKRQEQRLSDLRGLMLISGKLNDDVIKKTAKYLQKTKSRKRYRRIKRTRQRKRSRRK